MKKWSVRTWMHASMLYRGGRKTRETEGERLTDKKMSKWMREREMMVKGRKREWKDRIL